VAGPIRCLQQRSLIERNELEREAGLSRFFKLYCLVHRLQKAEKVGRLLALRRLVVRPHQPSELGKLGRVNV
jgi:hypothetical protein